jgi:Fe-S cluster biogenesis protein NfuA
LVQLVKESDFEVGGDMIHPDLVPALMARLGDVRSALTSHEGAITVREAEVHETTVHLVVGLDGACVACGAAPGTLSGIQNDLLADSTIQSIQFDKAILDSFDGIVREFLIEKSGVTFC